MATPTIPNGEEHFFVSKYVGNGAGQRVGKFVPFTDSGTIANSCIFDDGDSAYLSKTYGSAGTSQKKFTFSCWVKRGFVGNDSLTFFNVGAFSGSYFVIGFNSGTYANAIQFYNWTGSAYTLRRITNRTFEDTSKFYHIVVAIDTTQATASDRVKLYVDGDEITSFQTSVDPSQDADILVGGADSYYVGSDSSNHFDGYLAEVNYVDGQALTPASFGLTDTSTGRWIPKTVSPFPTTTTDIAVTVVSSGGNKYALDGVTQGTVTLIEGATYKFDQSDSSNSGHPLRFSTTSDGTHGGGSEFTSGVTTAGTPGSSGAYTEITVPTGTATLYYYCSNHSGMGGQANTQDQYGTNGFRLKFQDSSSLGDDTSGNTNDFTATNLASTDQTTDSPTQNFNTFGSFASGTSASEGNLTISTGTTNGDTQCVAQAGFGVATGKWYWEAKITTVGAGLYGWKDDANAGGSQAVNTSSNGTHSTNNSAGMLSTGSSGSFSSGSWFIDGGYGDEVNYTTVSTNDVLMFAIDLDTGKGYCGKNGTWFNSANPANGTGEIGGCHFANGINKFYPMARRLDSNSVAEYNFGQRSFAHTPPTGFSALQQDNLPETAKGISGLVWTKNRDAGDDHQLYDSSRGKHLVIEPNQTTAEATLTDGVQKFLKGGQQIEDNDLINTSGESFVSWNWVANGASTSSNTDGSITSTVQANTTAGFSIVQYTGTGSAATVGHGLSKKLDWVMTKSRSNDTGDGLVTYHTGLTSASYYVDLSKTNAQANASVVWNGTAPTSSVFSIGTASGTNTNTYTYVAYCWHSVDGFSKFGSYTGNGSTNGQFIYTGFTPSFLLIKRTDSSTGGNWSIIDSTRYPTNPIGAPLLADTTDPESGLSSITMDLLSNGFKIRNTLNSNNASGGSYIFCAFAKCPFANISPATAR